MLRRGKILRLRSLPVLALVAGIYGSAFALGQFWSVKVRPVRGPSVSRAVVKTVETAETSTASAESDALQPSERYIASNRFSVREGADAAFEQRWAQRKSSLLTLPGFRWFSLMRRVPDDSVNFGDDYSYISFTIWETKKDFNFWRKGPAFKEAHGGGGILDFLGMIMSSFMTSKGPPKPFFWEGVLPVTSSQSKERLQSGPGGRPEADGQTMLDPEVFVQTIRFKVADGREQDFEEFWSEHGEASKAESGFRFSQLLRRDQVPDDDSNYLGVTVWDDRDAYDKASVDTSSAGDLLERPAMKVLYEGKLVLESELGP